MADRLAPPQTRAACALGDDFFTSSEAGERAVRFTNVPKFVERLAAVYPRNDTTILHRHQRLTFIAPPPSPTAHR